MAIITVVSAGVMGTALTYPAADTGHEIRLAGTIQTMCFFSKLPLTSPEMALSVKPK